MNCEKRSLAVQNKQGEYSPVQHPNNFIKEGYFTHLIKNISNQFNKDPCRTKVHEQIIGSLIF